MKQIWVLTLGILVALSFAAGCSVQTEQPSTVPATPTANQNVTGLFVGATAAVSGGNATVNIQTSGGAQTFLISPNTTLTLGGKACTINDLTALQSGNNSYNCTVIYNNAMGVFGVYVTGGIAK